MKQQHTQHLYWCLGFGRRISELDNLKSDSKSNIIISIFPSPKMLIYYNLIFQNLIL